MTNIKIKFYGINNSRVPNDYLKNIPFNGVQTKSSDRMYKFYLQSVPQENRTQGEMSPCEH